MGSESIPHKLHYDITMSKRTRKPAKIQDEVQNLTSNRDDLDLDPDSELNRLPVKVVKGGLESPATKGSENNDHKSLKQLINGEGKAKTSKPGSDEGNRGRNSLGQHFTEDQEEENTNLQLVIRKQQQADGLQGVKLKKLVGKMLRNLMKGGEQHRLKKPRKKSLL